jgi:hypothetical protein
MGHAYLEKNPPEKIRNIVGPGPGLCEHKIVIQKSGYDIVCVPDWVVNEHVVEYKFGSIDGYNEQIALEMETSGKKRALICQCAPIWDGIEVVGADIKYLKEFRRKPTDMERLMLAFDEMENTIKYQITNGYFDDYLRRVNLIY